MRIVSVADSHTFETDLGVLPEGDVFVHAGDMCRSGDLDEMREVAGWIRAQPFAHKIVVAGNHDWCFERDRAAAAALLGDGVIYLQDEGVELGGLRFWGSPWQPEFHNWAFNLPRGAALAAKWREIPTGIDVLITHGPPAGFGDRSWDTRTGCEDLLSAIRRVGPALHVFGHIHQDGGFWRDGEVCFVNATVWECERAATVVDVDPGTRLVTPISIPPAATGSSRPLRIASGGSATCVLEIVHIADGTFPEQPLAPRQVGDRMEFEVRGGHRIMCGRARGVDILLEAATVSRQSCYFELTEGKVLFTDWSGHGATVNGGPPFPKQHELSSGDHINVFPFTLRFELKSHD